jgi:hypothetical protein
MIGDLPQDEAEAVLLRCVMGIDDAAAATVVGVQRGTLRRAAVRGLQALSRRLEAAAGGAGGGGGADGDASEILREPVDRMLRVVPDPQVVRRPEPGRTRQGSARTASWPAQPLPRIVNCDVTDPRGLEVSQ